MDYQKFLLASFICSFLILSISSSYAQNFSQGLIFASDDQLRGVPLASTPFSGNDLKRKVDLSGNMPTPGNQGMQNSCVGWAVAYSVKTYQEKIEEGHSLERGGIVDHNNVFSPSYIYNQINQGQDGGSLIIDALNLVSQRGSATLADMPYHEYDYLTKPSQDQHENAKRYKIDFWRRVNVADVKEVKAQIQAGYPVIIGAYIDNNFTQDGLNNPSYVWRQTFGQTSGHCMSVVGYDDDQGVFKLMNSWGPQWGNNGFGSVSYDQFLNAVKEGYVMKDAINGPENTLVINDNPITDINNDDPINHDEIELIDPNDLFDDVNFVLDDIGTTKFFVSNIEHNIRDFAFNPGEAGMGFSGSVQIPNGYGRNYQVVIYFYYDDGYGNSMGPVASLNMAYSDITGNAAAFTLKKDISGGQSVDNYWETNFPYPALNITRGQYYDGIYYPVRSNLIAQPVLFLDDFIVQYGTPYRFWVEL